jgi:hypothetical protein
MLCFSPHETGWLVDIKESYCGAVGLVQNDTEKSKKVGKLVSERQVIDVARVGMREMTVL